MMKTNHSVESILGQSAAADSSSYSDLACPPRNRQRRSRTAFSDSALSCLEDAFDKQPYPDIALREQLADEIGLTEARIQVWFQNRRSRLRRRQGISKRRTSSKQTDSPNTSPVQSPSTTPPHADVSIPSSQHITKLLNTSTPIHGSKHGLKQPVLSPIATYPTDFYNLTHAYQFPLMNGYSQLLNSSLPYHYTPLYPDMPPAIAFSHGWSPNNSHFSRVYHVPSFITSPTTDSGTTEHEQTMPIDLRSSHFSSENDVRTSHVSSDTGRGSESSHAQSIEHSTNPNDEIVDVVS